jgi:hypothetical protein
MRATTPVRLILAALVALGTAGLASRASAQLQYGGMNLEGDIEAGLQFFPEDPSSTRSQKFVGSIEASSATIATASTGRPSSPCGTPSAAALRTPSISR